MLTKPIDLLAVEEKIINETSARKILTESNNEILDNFSLDNYKILNIKLIFPLPAKLPLLPRIKKHWLEVIMSENAIY